MNIIFCSDDLDRRKPDEAYAAEVAALERVGGQHFLVNFDALVNDGDDVKAVRRVPEQATPGLAMYRGWMLKPATYSRLYEALAAKGLRLINDPAAYLYAGMAPPVDQFMKIAAAVKSRFFTMDIAKRRDGDWLIVELGDAQVAGLPENADVDGFYRAIAEHEQNDQGSSAVKVGKVK
jgi:hypothetical protein